MNISNVQIWRKLTWEMQKRRRQSMYFAAGEYWALPAFMPVEASFRIAEFTKLSVEIADSARQ